MSATEDVRIKQWIEGWKQAGIRMERLRKSELPSISTSEALQALADAYESCRLKYSPSPYSGLIDQQTWFKKYYLLNEQYD